jgi:hypothetical protein
MNAEERSRIKQFNQDHLIPYVGNTDPTALEDLLLVVAKNVEAALKAAGAQKGKDYTYLDLFTLAQPFALDIWNNTTGKNFRFQDF